MNPPQYVAIIEDNRELTDMYKLKFESNGYRIGIAANGEEGLILIKETLPDLILLDLKMPVMGGAEMLQRLRAEPWGSNVRVIMLTNISKDEAPSTLRFLRVDRYVVKAHHTPSQVVEIVSEVLGRH